MLAEVLKAPAVTANLKAQGLDVVGTCGDELRAQIKRQHEKYTGVIKDAGIKVE
jgi:tripartite-type tricarboxylate transporter receptor subunit TctC